MKLNKLNLQKFLNSLKLSILKPPSYFVIYAIFLNLFFLIIFIGTRFNISIGLIMFMGLSFLILFSYTIFENIVKHFELGRIIINLILFWFTITILFVSVDSVYNFSNNTNSRYISFERPNYQEEEIKSDVDESITSLNIVKNNGKMIFTNTDEKSLSVKENYYFNDEKIEFETGKNSFIVKQAEFTLNPNRIFSNKSPLYEISAPNSVKNLYFNSMKGDNSIVINNSNLQKTNIFAQDGEFKLELKSPLSRGSNHTLSLVKSSFELIDPQNGLESSSIKCLNSKGTILFNTSQNYEDIDIALNNCDLILTINNSIGFDIEYSSLSEFEIDGEKITQTTGTYVSDDIDDKPNRIVINLIISKNSSLVINSK